MSQSTPRSGASKFKLLQGFIKQDDPTDVKLDYTTGEAINYAGVGRLYYIDHPQDEAIHYRIVVIIRTNNDSWSCYSFCKHTDKNDCSHHDFVTEHIQIAEHKQGGHTSRSIVPRVALQLHDAEGKQLEVEPKIWINCRQMLDIKHTVRLASLGSIDPASLKVLLKKGRKVFNDTFGDCDKYNKTESETSKSKSDTSNPSPPPRAHKYTRVQPQPEAAEPRRTGSHKAAAHTKMKFWQLST